MRHLECSDLEKVEQWKEKGRIVVEWVQSWYVARWKKFWSLVAKKANVFNSTEMDTWKWKWSRLVKSKSLRPHGLSPTRLLCPGKSTGVGCHFLLQGIFPTQKSNPGLLHCRQILYHLSHQGIHDKRRHIFFFNLMT